MSSSPQATILGLPLSVPIVAAVAAAGLALGMGGYAFAYAKGSSYLGNDPAACANCHVMSGHLAGWLASSHHGVATCNDCHTPAPLAARVLTKATNGYHHSLAFTTGAFPDVILARPGSLEVVEGQCRHCHADVLMAMGGEDVACVRCHPSVGHLR